jgi:hypothetical protein
LADTPVRDFPPPPSGALAAPDCPTVIGTIGEAPPPGCPSPSAMEFGPSPSGAAGSAVPSGDAGPSPSAILPSDGPGFVPPDQPSLTPSSLPTEAPPSPGGG